MRSDDEIEAAPAQCRPSRHHRLRFLGGASGEDGDVVDDDTLVDAFHVLDKRRCRAATQPRDLCSCILRAQRSHHRQRHHDVADGGQFDD